MNDNQQEKLVLVDGEIMPEAEAFIDVNDRGHNFGDGVFEIVPVYNGRCFALLPHMNNLFDSVIAVKIPGVYMIEELVEFHESLLAATGLRNLYSGNSWQRCLCPVLSGAEHSASDYVCCTG